MPAGLVRTECFLAVAEAAKNLGDTQRAMDAWRRVIDDESSPKGERVIALRATVDTHVERGDWSAAREAVVRWGDVAPTVRDKTLKLYRRMAMTRTSMGLVGLLIAFGAYALGRLSARGGVRAVRRAFSWVMIALPAVIAVGGAGFAWWNEGHGMEPFLQFAPGLAVLMLSARACRLAFPSIPARAGVALVGVLAACSLAWLSMLGSPGMMEGFGL